MALDHKLGAAFIDGGVKHRILGATLRPFCLWHLYLLQAIDSPFVRKGDVTLFDLKTAVGICRLRFRDSKIRRPFFYFQLRHHSLRRDVDRMLLYIGDYLQRPDYSVHIKESPDATPAGSRGAPPESLQVAWDILGWSSFDEAYVWEMPIGAAYAHQAGALRARGADLDFMTDKERKFQADMKAAQEKAK